MGIFPYKNLGKVWEQWTKEWELKKLREQEDAMNEIEKKKKEINDLKFVHTVWMTIMLALIIILLVFLVFAYMGCAMIGTADRPAMMSKWRGQPVMENLFADINRYGNWAKKEIQPNQESVLTR